MAAAVERRLRAVPRLRHPAVRVQRDRVRDPRARRHVHPLRGGARAARLRAGARGDRRARGAGSPRGGSTGTRRRRPGSSSAAPSRSGCSTSIVGVGAVHASWAEQTRRPFQAVARRPRRAPVRRRRDRVMAIDASGIKYWTGHPGVVLVDDPLDTVEKVARAYGIRWLVLEPKDSVAAVTEIFVERPTPVVGRSADPARGRRRPLSRCASIPATRDVRPGPPGRCDEPPRGLAHGAGRVRRRARRPDLRGLDHLVPQARGHRLLRRRRPEPRRGSRAWVAGSFRRPLELRDAAAAVPATRVRGLAPAPLAARRHPDRPERREGADPARDRDARGPGPAGGRRLRSSASSPGGWPPTSRSSARCPSAGRGRSRSAPGSRPPSTCRCSCTRPSPTRRCCSGRSCWAPRCS